MTATFFAWRCEISARQGAGDRGVLPAAIPANGTPASPPLQIASGQAAAPPSPAGVAPIAIDPPRVSGTTLPTSDLPRLRFGSHNYVIRSSYFHENRARGLLLQTAGGLVEGNRFFHDQMAALHLTADIDPAGRRASAPTTPSSAATSSRRRIAWATAMVSPSSWAPSSVAARSHIPCCKTSSSSGTPSRKPPAPSSQPPRSRLLPYAVTKSRTSSRQPVDARLRGAVRVELGSGLWVEDNDWASQQTMTSPALFYDPGTTTTILCENNHLPIGGSVRQSNR
jgi:hypothetical protein